MKTALFLCSGNYYRSRFAEALFNYLAPQHNLPWRAESRGFRLSPNNVGPISIHAVDGLAERGIDLAAPHRMPAVVEETDFHRYALVIAVKEAEHRQKMEARFPLWANRIHYWQIHDIDCAAPPDALAELEQQVRQLIERLKMTVA